MKIAQVVSTFPPRIGGMGQVAWEEADRLVKAGHEVIVFTPRYKDSHLDMGGDFKVVYLDAMFRSDNAAWLPKLYNKLTGFNIVHLHYPFYGGAEFVWLAKKFKKQPYVVTYHMDAQTQGLGKVVQSVYDLIWPRLILGGATKVITVDQDHFNNCKFKKFVRPDKLVEIYNGVDVEVFEPVLGIPTTDKKIILFVGNLLPFKRFDLLLQALKQIRDQSAEVLVVGGGYGLDKYKKMAEDLGLKDRVIFAGYCYDRKKLAEYYSSASCLAVCSDSGESFSLTAIEALASGCLVVASDIPGVRERVIDGQTGFVFKSGSVEDLTDKINKVLTLSLAEKKTMGERGRQEILAKYSWDKHMEKLLQIYES